jgi:hypothetical protein
LRERTGATFKEFCPEEGANMFLETVTVYQSRERRFPLYSNIQGYSCFLRGKKREANIAAHYSMQEHKWIKGH